MQSAIVFGAGNIGRGFIGQLFSESGRHVTFVDVDAEIVEALVARGSYRIETVFNERRTEYRVGPVTALNGNDLEAVAEAVARAEIGATAVGVRALPYVVPNIAAGIVKRAVAGETRPLNLIICENLKNAAAEVRRMVRDRLPPEFVDYFTSRIGFVDTVIGRMVPRPTPEMRAADPTFIRVEPYKELPVDRAGFVGPVPRIEAMTAHSNFAVFTARKLYLHNCGHALLAYAGYLRGRTYGFEALDDPVVRTILHGGIEESKAGIVHRYGADPAWLDEHVGDLLRRFANRALGDTVLRLGRDPVRKLGAEDRLVGAARLAEAAGRRPRRLAQGIAAALHFDPAEDEVACELQRLIERRGPGAALQQVSGIGPEEPLGRLVLAEFEEWARHGRPKTAVAQKETD
ncbi:MAG: mannitol-1-phosphate 5-dehydrogenase [Kiritimatiellaeota bacterium]|nr:mannitol-1-phosphate 5-dehydrogenase [Kiritimatiellota bacterium]